MVVENLFLFLVVQSYKNWPRSVWVLIKIKWGHVFFWDTVNSVRWFVYVRTAWWWWVVLIGIARSTSPRYCINRLIEDGITNTRLCTQHTPDCLCLSILLTVCYTLCICKSVFKHVIRRSCYCLVILIIAVYMWRQWSDYLDTQPVYFTYEFNYHLSAMLGSEL